MLIHLGSVCLEAVGWGSCCTWPPASRGASQSACSDATPGCCWTEKKKSWEAGSECDCNLYAKLQMIAIFWLLSNRHITTMALHWWDIDHKTNILGSGRRSYPRWQLPTHFYTLMTILAPSDVSSVYILNFKWCISEFFIGVLPLSNEKWFYILYTRNLRWESAGKQWSSWAP